MRPPTCLVAALIVVTLVAVAPPASLAAEAPVFNTIRVQGKNYVNLADFVRFNEFDGNWLQAGMDITLKAKYKRLELQLGSRECLVNGVRIWLNEAPLEYRNSILLPETDIRKALNPVLRPWAVPEMKVKTIMIDPGHGGEDRGTQGSSKSTEKRLTLDMAARLEKLLKQAGFRTLMTRRTDSYVSLEDRSELSNASEADLFVSLHFNSAKPDSKPNGIETYCLTPVGFTSTGFIGQRLGIGKFAEEPGNSQDQNNMLLAYSIQQKLLEAVPEAEDRGIKRARFYVIKATERPAVLVELGFLSNPVEEKRILSSLYRDRLAKGILEGIRKYAEFM